jgi:hypothetical protein
MSSGFLGRVSAAAGGGTSIASGWRTQRAHPHSRQASGRVQSAHAAIGLAFVLAWFPLCSAAQRHVLGRLGLARPRHRLQYALAGTGKVTMQKTPDNSEHLERPPAQSETGRAGLERFLLAYAKAPADAELTLGIACLDGTPDALFVVCEVSGLNRIGDSRHPGTAAAHRGGLLAPQAAAGFRVAARQMVAMHHRRPAIAGAGA